MSFCSRCRAAPERESAPEVNALQAVDHLLQLLGRVEGLQPIGLDDLLQLGQQALLCSSIEAPWTEQPTRLRIMQKLLWTKNLLQENCPAL